MGLTSFLFPVADRAASEQEGAALLGWDALAVVADGDEDVVGRFRRRGDLDSDGAPAAWEGVFEGIGDELGYG